MLFADPLLYLLLCACLQACACVRVCVRGACGYVPVCLCVCLCAALTGSKRHAGKALRRVIMRCHRRVHNGALWVFLFVLANLRFLSFPPPPPISKVVRMNEISEGASAARARSYRASHLHTRIDASGGTAVTSLGSRRPPPNINMRLTAAEEEPS